MFLSRRVISSLVTHYQAVYQLPPGDQKSEESITLALQKVFFGLQNSDDSVGPYYYQPSRNSIIT